MSFKNMTPDTKKLMQDLQQQSKDNQKQFSKFLNDMKKNNDEFIRITREKAKEAKDAEWKPKPVHLGTPNIGTIPPAHSQVQYHQVQQPIDTSNDTGNPVTQSVKTVQPVTHHMKAMFVFLGCLAITIVLGLFIGSMFGSKFNLANAAGVWGGGLYITYEITKGMWRKHDG